MNAVPLPPSINQNTPAMPDSRQLVIIGANGAGKSLFMDELMELCGERAFSMNALSAFYAEREESTRPGSIDAQYRRAVTRRKYMRTDAVSKLDKLIYMLFADELDSLLESKSRAAESKKKPHFEITGIDRIRRAWRKLFPGSDISRANGQLLFTTYAGADLVAPEKLSQGEQTALYYLAGVLYAPRNGVIFVDSPSLFIHPAIMPRLWDTVEALRPDCTFVYNTVDVDFISGRSEHTCIWVKQYSSANKAWEYEILANGPETEDIILRLAGSRRPVLFIEGDQNHSIDVRLYSAVFHEYTVKPLGGCDKVIESTRSFNDLYSLHRLKSIGIVDRDRRTDEEVNYLRRKKILVPDVAEIENIFLLTDVLRIMAGMRGKNPDKIINSVKKHVFRLFRKHAEEQALQHIRHRIKREIECKIDAKFNCITALETHLGLLPSMLQPRKRYNRLREQFSTMIRDEDYESILRVFNHKPMLPSSEAHLLLGYHSKEDYINGVITLANDSGKEAEALRNAIRHILRADENTNLYENNPK